MATIHTRRPRPSDGDRDAPCAKRACPLTVGPVAGRSESMHTTCPIVAVPFHIFSDIGAYLGYKEIGRLSCVGSPFVTAALTKLEDVSFILPPAADFYQRTINHYGACTCSSRYRSHITGCSQHDRWRADTCIPSMRRLVLRVARQASLDTASRCSMIFRPSVSYERLRHLEVDWRAILPYITYRGQVSLPASFPVLEVLRLVAPQDDNAWTADDSCGTDLLHLLTRTDMPATLRHFELVYDTQNTKPRGPSDLYNRIDLMRCSGSYKADKACFAKFPPTMEVLRLPSAMFSLKQLRGVPIGLMALSVAMVEPKQCFDGGAVDWAHELFDAPHLTSLSIGKMWHPSGEWDATHTLSADVLARKYLLLNRHDIDTVMSRIGM